MSPIRFDRKTTQGDVGRGTQNTAVLCLSALKSPDGTLASQNLCPCTGHRITGYKNDTHKSLACLSDKIVGLALKACAFLIYSPVFCFTGGVDYQNAARCSSVSRGHLITRLLWPTHKHSFYSLSRRIQVRVYMTCSPVQGACNCNQMPRIGAGVFDSAFCYPSIASTQDCEEFCCKTLQRAIIA